MSKFICIEYKDLSLVLYREKVNVEGYFHLENIETVRNILKDVEQKETKSYEHASKEDAKLLLEDVDKIEKKFKASCVKEEHIKRLIETKPDDPFVSKIKSLREKMEELYNEMNELGIQEEELLNEYFKSNLN